MTEDTEPHADDPIEDAPTELVPEPNPTPDPEPEPEPFELA